MKVSKQLRREAKRLLRACRVQNRLDEARIRRAVDRVIQEKPRGYIRVLSCFLRLVKLEVRHRTARVQSATTLDAGLREGIRASLERVYGQGLYLEFEEEKELLGGARIQVGSDVWDGSIRGRLRDLGSRFAAG